MVFLSIWSHITLAEEFKKIHSMLLTCYDTTQHSITVTLSTVDDMIFVGCHSHIGCLHLIYWEVYYYLNNQFVCIVVW